MENKREEMNWDEKIKNDELREQQFKEEYGRSLESNITKWDEQSNVEQIWEQLEEAVADRTREVCSS